jgi:glycosyltransferase involved in cell wall biosynthesis
VRVLVGVRHWGVIGGSERYAAELVPLLTARGHQVLLLAASASAPAPAGASIAVVARSGERRPPRSALAELAGAAAAAAPDVVLSLSSGSDEALGALVAGARAPLVRFVQDHVPFCPGLNKLHADGTRCARAVGAACLERCLLGAGCLGFHRAQHAGPLAAAAALHRHLSGLERLRGAAAVLVASEYMRRELLGAGLDPERVRVLPYFAPRPAASKSGAPDGAPLLLAPARLVLPDKGLDVLLDALARLARPFTAAIAGAGPAEGALRARARELGLQDRVRFPGWLAPPELDALYARALAVIVPSVWDEPFGLVGLEAMAHGRAVLASDVGGIREWLADGRTGRLVPPGDARALAATLERWLATPTEAETLGRAGLERAAREFTPARHLDGLERVLARAGRL